jgi:hypothetical protein
MAYLFVLFANVSIALVVIKEITCNSPNLAINIAIGLLAIVEGHDRRPEISPLIASHSQHPSRYQQLPLLNPPRPIELQQPHPHPPDRPLQQLT